MATQGFQLSQFDRAPNVPSNIGVVDTQGIYGAVVDALKTNEALRTTQLVQAKTDAELTLARDKARTEQSLLEPEAATRRARANLLASEAAFAMPGVEGAARAKRAQDALASMRDELAIGNLPLASEVDQALLRQKQLEAQAVTPEVVDARTKAAMYQNQLAAGRAQRGLGLLDSEADYERLELQRKKREAEALSDPELIAQIARSKAFKGMPASIGTIQYAKMILADPNSTPEDRQSALVAMKVAPTPNADPNLIGQQKFEGQLGSQIAKIEAALPKQETAILTFEAKSDNFQSVLDQAEALVSPYSTGIAALAPLPLTEARALASLLVTIDANTGFTELQELRASSPTGAALGAVSDEENKRLSSSIANIDLTLSAETVLRRLQQLREYRQGAVKRLKEGFQRDQNAVQAYRSSKKLDASPLIAPPTGGQSFNYSVGGERYDVQTLPPIPVPAPAPTR